MTKTFELFAKLLTQLYKQVPNDEQVQLYHSFVQQITPDSALVEKVGAQHKDLIEAFVESNHTFFYETLLLKDLQKPVFVFSNALQLDMKRILNLFLEDLTVYKTICTYWTTMYATIHPNVVSTPKVFQSVQPPALDTEWMMGLGMTMFNLYTTNPTKFSDNQFILSCLPNEIQHFITVIMDDLTKKNSESSLTEDPIEFIRDLLNDDASRNQLKQVFTVLKPERTREFIEDIVNNFKSKLGGGSEVGQSMAGPQPLMANLLNMLNTLK